MLYIIIPFCIVMAFGWYGFLIGHQIYRVIKYMTPMALCTMTSDKVILEAARKAAEIEWKRRLALSKEGD